MGNEKRPFNIGDEIDFDGVSKLENYYFIKDEDENNRNKLNKKGIIFKIIELPD